MRSSKVPPEGGVLVAGGGVAGRVCSLQARRLASASSWVGTRRACSAASAFSFTVLMTH
jgi:hypothetical protein